MPRISFQLQQLQLAGGGKQVWQQSVEIVALKIEVGEIWGALKEASTKPVESVEGEVETFQGGQVVQLLPLQSREKVVAKEVISCQKNI